ncbi:MAG: nucleotidyltransferase family protein [Lachnospiraceae bacterium]|nr:nucleotidyltransferase family protein [Lachnospiraceae bacterium]
MNEETRKTADYLIALLKSVLDGTCPAEKPEQVSFEQLYKLAKFHCVQCMAYYAVEKLKTQPEPKQGHKWKSERDQHIVRSMIQLSERNSILENLMGAGIDALPLKGCLLKEMYPQADYREMADLDILIDAKKAELARKQMETLGYTTEHFAVSNHDNYIKSPYMGVELHRDMLHEQYEAHAYYKNVWEKAIPDEGRAHCFHFSWDDYYIFMLTHFAKHYFGGGSGIRSIMDIHVFLDRHKIDLHQNYLKQELEQLDLSEFKETAEHLAECWFGDADQTEKTEEMASYVISSGVYGTSKQAIKNKIKKAETKANSVWKGKVSYFFSRIFLPYKTMCFLFPVLKKLPILLPFCWLMRLILAVIQKRKRVKMELHMIVKSQKEKND